jgi:heat shock protein HslJ
MWRSNALKVLLVAGGLWFAGAAATTLDLAGSSWRLVQFTSKDDGAMRPDDPANYTLRFGADGRLAVRADCNRGSATWKSNGTAELTIGPVAATRAMCPPGSMSDALLRDLSNVASAEIRDGRLLLALKMSSGVYEFEVDPSSSAEGNSRGPFAFHCDGLDGIVHATFINAESRSFVRLQHGASTWTLDIGPSGSGARYVGPNGLLFWNKGRDATFNEGGGKPDRQCRQEDAG